MDLITPAAGLLFWMTLIFAAVFFILAKFGFPIITGMVHKRQEHIAASLRDAQSARESLASLQQTCEKMLDDTRREQEILLDKARSEAKTIVEQAQQRSRVEAEQMINRTARDLEQMKNDALKDMASVVAEISLTLSERILREKLSSDDAQIEYIDRLIDEQRSHS